jgi:hypothetical protein
MARVAELLDLMHPFFRIWLAILNTAIDEQEPSSGLQNTSRLMNKPGWRAEVMRRNPAGDQVEVPIRVRQLFRRVLPEFDR